MQEVMKQESPRSQRKAYDQPRLEKLGSWKHLTQMSKSTGGRGKGSGASG